MKRPNRRTFLMLAAVSLPLLNGCAHFSAQTEWERLEQTRLQQQQERSFGYGLLKAVAAGAGFATDAVNGD